MEEQPHAKQFCTDYCSILPSTDKAKCEASCVLRAESSLHNMMPEETRVIIDKIITHEPTSSEHNLKDERSDAIGALRQAVSSLATGLPGDFP
jgi:hypothetical protein